MSDLTNALDKILSWLQKNYPSHVALLQPGLTEAEINELLEDLPLQLPQDIRELYQWKNGRMLVRDATNKFQRSDKTCSVTHPTVECCLQSINVTQNRSAFTHH
ncbi:MAG: hypothetical protein KME29_03915 [Calothrix sp. FI2-JRJ7]|jgi:cell wall assembly regulator SMI1|nr:hypothetical protein [Calothrix sp. FI2-JRJ7]